MGYLITSSILDSFDWLKNAPQNWKQRANEDFLAALRRTKRFAPTPEIKRGMDFEDFVCKNVNTMSIEAFADLAEYTYEQQLAKDSSVSVADYKQYLTNCVNTCKQFYEACIGGEQQVKVTRDLYVEGNYYTLFGYADVVFPTYILDIKTTTHYKTPEKYLRRAQHLLYMWATKKNRFIYVIADFKGTPYPLGFNYVEVDGGFLTKCEDALRGRIHNFTAYLRANGLWGDYITIFSGKHGGNTVTQQTLNGAN